MTDELLNFVSSLRRYQIDPEVRDELLEKISSARAPAQSAPDPLSEQQRHAVEHARWQVSQSTPQEPECCFDYELVATLIEIIDRATASSSPVRPPQAWLDAKAEIDADWPKKNPIQPQRAPLPSDDAKLFDWLEDQVVSEIYLDDGRLIDVRGNSVRAAVRAALTRPKCGDGQ